MLSSRYQDVFALLVPSCCDKSGTSCHHLNVPSARLMTVTELLQVVPTSLIQTVRYELAVISLLTICYVQTASDLFEQLVARLLI